MAAGTTGVGEEHRWGQNVIGGIGETGRFDAVEAGTFPSAVKATKGERLPPIS